MDCTLTWVIIILIIFILWKNKYESYTNQKTLTMYYADWCPHCKVFKPKWEVISKQLTASGVNCVSYECDENKEICNNAGVTGFPTIRYTNANGVTVDYSGAREIADIITYVQSN